MIVWFSVIFIQIAAIKVRTSHLIQACRSTDHIVDMGFIVHRMVKIMQSFMSNPKKLPKPTIKDCPWGKSRELVDHVILICYLYAICGWIDDHLQHFIFSYRKLWIHEVCLFFFCFFFFCSFLFLFVFYREILTFCFFFGNISP